MDQPLRNSSINWIFLWRFPIQDHLKLPITEKRRNKTRYLTWNSIRLQDVKKTSMPNFVESLGYIKCCSSSNPRPVKVPSNPIRHNCQKIFSWLRRSKTLVWPEVWPDTYDEGYIFINSNLNPPMEHLSNDHEDHPNQHENSHKPRDETGYPILGLLESQWKLRQ